MFRFTRHATKSRSATAAVFGSAFVVRESAPYDTPSELKIAPNQRVEKQFRLNDEASTTKIDKLVLAVPGYTRVSYNAVGRENVIRVSSDTLSHVDAVKVVPHGSYGLEVCTKHSLGSSGHLLVEIFLAQPAQVKELACSSSGVAVVEENVLVNSNPDDKVVIKQSGSGNLFVTSVDSLMHSLSLSLVGSGSIHLAVPSLTVVDKTSLALAASGTLHMFTNKLDTGSAKVAVGGSGDIQLSTQTLVAREKLSIAMAGSGEARVFGSTIHTHQVKCAIAGSGDIRIGAHDLLAAKSVKTSIAGSGNVTMGARTAECKSNDISIAGSGDVDAGDLVAKKVKISIIGSGDSIVQATESIKYSKMGSGSIKYVGPAPAEMTGTGWKHGLQQLYRNESQSVSDRIAARWKAPTAIPVKEEAFDKIAVRSMSGGTSHDFYFEMSSWGEMIEKAQHFFGLKSTPPTPPMPPMPPMPPVGTTAPTGAMATVYRYEGDDDSVKAKMEFQQPKQTL